MQIHQKKKIVASLSIVSNVILSLLKIITGIFSGSLSIISEAIHSLSDFFASILTLFSVIKSSQPADNDHPYGYIAGARRNYKDGETETEARGLIELQPGDTLDFTCDYYSYDGTYQDSYYLGEQMTVTENMEISNTDVGENYIALYKFTDIYNQPYYTEPVKK